MAQFYYRVFGAWKEEEIVIISIYAILFPCGDEGGRGHSTSISLRRHHYLTLSAPRWHVLICTYTYNKMSTVTIMVPFAGDLSALKNLHIVHSATITGHAASAMPSQPPAYPFSCEGHLWGFVELKESVSQQQISKLDLIKKPIGICNLAGVTLWAYYVYLPLPSSTRI